MIAVSGLDNFPWPKPNGSDERPVWCGDAFVLGNERRRILEFGAADSHWSPELTALHEQEAGVNHPIDRASRQLAVRSLKRFLAADTPVVLDIGCSSGHLLEEIRRVLPNAALIGSDYLLPPLVKLAQKMRNLPILRFDLRRCPLADECVDAITALNVLEHIDKDEEALRQIYRILRPGGMVHVEVPAGPHLYDIYDKHLMHHRRYRLTDLAMMAKRVSFEIVRATHLGFIVYPAFWIIKKSNRRRFTFCDTAQSADRVRTHIRDTGESRIMKALMKIELALSRAISFPVGIRCVLVARKPA